MSAFGIRTILLLFVIGGITALIGDYIGKSIGRKRLSFLKLRPRHTAFFFTILTGSLIALITVSIILAISKDARTALFGLDQLRNDLMAKTDILEKTKQELAERIKDKAALDKALVQARVEISSLEKVRKKLFQEVEVSRQGKVLFAVDETVLTSVIQAGPEREKVEKGLKQILSAANIYPIEVSPDEFEKAIKLLMARRGENILMLKALRNTVLGEKVPVRIEIEENRLVYKSGEEIAYVSIPAALTVPEIEQEVKNLLSLTHRSAREAGIIPDPNGSLGSVPYSEIFALAQKIKAYKKQIQLKSAAKSNIYRTGPLEVSFKIYYL